MTVYKTAREEILKDWQANLQDFASEHEFPAEATESLQDALEIIGADDRLYANLPHLGRKLLERSEYGLSDTLATLEPWMEQTESPIYAGASFYHRNQQTHQRTL